MEYSEFLDNKSQFTQGVGIKANWMPDFLFDFQQYCVDISLFHGRYLLAEDCGMGKGIQGMVWGENVVRHTNKPVIIPAPLAVSHQLVREAKKFGIDAIRSIDGTVKKGLVFTNYERLSAFNPNDFAGCACDESSVLKNFNGVRRREITEFMKKMAFRLCSTATPSPNDFVELGTTSEALGYLGHMDMLATFFKNDRSTCDTRGHMRGNGAPRSYEQPGWRFKGHAEDLFWRWVVSWARAARKPSDLGFDDARFILPPLCENTHLVDNDDIPVGQMFKLPAVGLDEQREERRRTLKERCEKVAELVNETGQPAFVGYQLDVEGDILRKMIKDGCHIHGKLKEDRKEDLLVAFSEGRERVAIIQDKIGCFGLNLQHCAHIVRFPTHSHEMDYQFKRRCWRFGQTKAVTVDYVVTPGDERIIENLARKEAQAERMFTSLVRHTQEAMNIDRPSAFTTETEVPSWL